MLSSAHFTGLAMGIAALGALPCAPVWAADAQPAPSSTQASTPGAAPATATTGTAGTGTAATGTAKDTATSSTAAPTSAEPIEEVKVSVNVAAGIGGGTFGFSGRFGGDFHIWLTEQIGIGAGAAGVTESEIFGDAFEYWSAGPSLAVRTPPPDGYWFGSLSMRFVGATLTDAQEGCVIFCPDPVRLSFDAPGVTLRGGGVAQIGTLEIGGAGILDLIISDSVAGQDHVAKTFTVNFVLGFGT